MHGVQQEFFNAADYFVDRNIRQGRGHKIAVYTEYRNYTYNDIQKMTNKTANSFRELGLGIEEAKLAIIDYIETWYNSRRIHSSLNDMSPMEFEGYYKLSQGLVA
jgi:transposase InsO family protein